MLHLKLLHLHLLRSKILHPKKHAKAKLLSKLLAGITLCFLVIPPPVFAANIANLADLQANSTTISSGGSTNDTYELNVGNHTVPSATTTIVINTDAIHSMLMNDSGSTLTLGAATTHSWDLLRVKNFYLNHGTLISNGGTSAGSYGLIVTDTLMQNNASVINATGGTINNAHGLLADTNLIQNNTASIVATGGSGASNAYGLYVTRMLTQNGAATITATGGSTHNAFGTYVGNTLTQNNTATITATGGTGQQAHGMYIMHALIQNNDSILTTIGGSAQDAYGINVTNVTQNNAARIIARGSAAQGGQGLFIANAFIQNDSANLTTTGGSGLNAYGTYVHTNLTQNQSSTIAATGGSGQNSHGFFVTNNLIQNNNAQISAQGGTAQDANGMRVNGNLIQNDTASLIARGGAVQFTTGAIISGNLSQNGSATLSAIGGSVQDTMGMSIVATLTQNDNAHLGATGGDGTNAYGLHANGTLTQNDTAGLIARGGAGQSAYGVSLSDNLVQNNATTLTTTGGTGQDAYGVFIVRDFIQNHTATITATGGTGQDGHGLLVTNDFTQNDTATITATGGSGTRATGAGINNDFTQNDTATITATGGNGQGATGLWVTNDFTQNDTATITATGGSGQESYGLVVTSDFTQNQSAAITATGGSNTRALGLGVNSDFTQNNSATLTTTGGSGLETHGLVVTNDFTQNQSAAITATGGTGHFATGLGVVNNFTQNDNATINATAGSGQDAYGIYVDKHASFAGTVQLNPTTNPHATIYIANASNAATALEVTPTSVFMPVMDGNSRQTGRIQVDNGNTTIASGAQVQTPKTRNVYSFTKGQTYTNLFLEHTAGAINGEFTLNNPSLIMDVSISKQGNEYYISLTRTTDMPTLLGGRLETNERNLTRSFTNLAGLNTPKSLAIRQLADTLENSTSINEALATTHTLQRNLTPHAFTQVPRQAVQSSMLARQALLNNLHATALFTEAATSAVASDSAANALAPIATYELASLDNSALYGNNVLEEQVALGWQAWLETYGSFGTSDASNREFADAKQKTAGVSIGVRRVFETGHSVAIAGHYLNNTLKSDGASAFTGKNELTSNTFGASIGARLLIPQWQTDALAPLAPYVNLTATYSSLDIEQERHVYGTRLDSDTTGSMYQAGASFHLPITVGSTDFGASSAFVFTPEVGATYSFVDIKGYSEGNSNNLGLNVNPDDYSSLLVHLGIRMDAHVAPKTTLYASATVSHELLDDEVELNNSFRSASQLKFQTIGEDNNQTTAYLRAGLNTNLWRSVSLNTEYTFAIAEDSQNHSLGLNFSIGF